MADRSVTGSIATNVLAATFNPGLTYGNVAPNAKDSLPVFDSLKWLSGTGAGKVNLLAYAGASLAAAPVTHDLTAMTDKFGQTVNFAKVRALLILNYSTTDILTVGAASSNPWNPFLGGTTPTLIVRPGYTDTGINRVRPGIALLGCGDSTAYEVSGTSKVLKIDPGSATISYFLALLGSDA